MHEQGQERYHDTVCREIDLPEDATATMGTAANMNYAAVVEERRGRERRGGCHGGRGDQRGVRGRSGELARNG